MPSIVIIRISETVAPLPITLQETGAFVSQGATNLSPGAYSLLTQESDLTPLLAAPLAISSMAWSAGTVLVTTVAAIPGLNTGDAMITTIAGSTAATIPGGYNGTYLAMVTGANTFTFPLAVNPGSESVPGTYTPPNQGELQSMASTFFGQGSGQAVYVLELGPGDKTNGPAALGTYDQVTNPGFFYSYLVPRGWDASAGLLALVAQYEALSAKKYFFITTTPSTYQNYTAQMKSAVLMVEAVSTQNGGKRPLTEFSLAAIYQVTLNYAPSATNRQTQLRYAYLFGVTPYPTVGNSSLLNALATANVSVVGTGAEGGITTAIVSGGTTADGNDFTWWYSVDWIQLQTDQAISNAIINGSNNPLNPLYYDQQGINTLQDVVVQTVGNAISFGLATGTVARAALDGPPFSAALDAGTYIDQDVVNAIPFTIYTNENPSAYEEGLYGGLSVVYIPQRGFKQIIFNIQVSNLLST